jgi:hypothetical protein
MQMIAFRTRCHAEQQLRPRVSRRRLQDFIGLAFGLRRVAVQLFECI